ncbi:DinB family protein [Paenibacillus chartarius]|uniref:DinB family protein n=1 Tax=Paenibacillus chartarius TaxID=747481 RepID=A0ABV6DP63_9BACL
MVLTDIVKQFDLTRDALLKTVETVTESEAERVPDGFNNSIKWHAGHTLFATNRAFEIFESASYLPDHYGELFKPGTSPRDWTTGAPTLRQLIEQLELQKGKIREVFSHRTDHRLEPPFQLKAYGGLELHTAGELLNFFIFHEAMHVGHIKTFKQLLQTDEQAADTAAK